MSNTIATYEMLMDELNNCFSNEDEWYYYESLPEGWGVQIHQNLYDHLNHLSDPKQKVSSFYFMLDEKLDKPNEKTKYAQRITNVSDKKKIFTVYNLETLLAYTVICEKSDRHICFGDFMQKLLKEFTFVYKGKTINGRMKAGASN